MSAPCAYRFTVVSLPFGVHENENYTKQTLEEAINLLDSAKECARMAVFLLQHQGFAANFRESVLTLVNILTSEETLRSNQVSSAINVGFLIGKIFRRFTVMAQ